MRLIKSRRISRPAFVTACVVLIAAAFLRGVYLFGLDFGIIYALITVGLLWHFARSFTRAAEPSHLRVIAIGILSLLIGFAMAFPASVNQDVQTFIDYQATDRAACMELLAIFQSDPAFAHIAISTMHRKGVGMTLSGSLPRHADYERLRDRIRNECPAVAHCALHWDVIIRDSNEKIDGYDRDLFAAKR